MVKEDQEGHIIITVVRTVTTAVLITPVVGVVALMEGVLDMTMEMVDPVGPTMDQLVAQDQETITVDGEVDREVDQEVDQEVDLTVDQEVVDQDQEDREVAQAPMEEEDQDLEVVLQGQDMDRDRED